MRAPGYRNRDTGVPVSVGNGGYDWSSATIGTGGLNLNFSSQHLYTGYSNGRAYGFLLRCLSE
ncbi:hypothetical protein [uncultured Rikenella sp.]|uniref:hypothetical protein n=1 Tax=uncultured Rikenella sp. TaxID=368003 RepID=UPI00263275F5|nr:hypothetical protein [uncultured Rikenella sp.]